MSVCGFNGGKLFCLYVSLLPLRKEFFASISTVCIFQMLQGIKKEAIQNFLCLRTFLHSLRRKRKAKVILISENLKHRNKRCHRHTMQKSCIIVFCERELYTLRITTPIKAHVFTFVFL